MLFRQITIVGVGLIGGSFALAARRCGLAARITGWNEAASLERALDLGVIDEEEPSFDEGRVCDADLIYLAAPVRGIVSFLREKGNLIKPGAIVTDAGSAKREICRAARASLPPEVHFVGGHPMAGSHQTGVESANNTLFQDAPYVLIEDEERRADALNRVAQAVAAIGGRPVFLTAEEHDR
ncbi:MAG TPA: prephenate dehydrogenase/arogenate dehydrogenase family protein, partial [Blastocatellia bacterium]|nr:prephenate dehydrogenase/arogenate dehydrogenase family protein [Blastocatellia bacterium]